MHTIIIQVIGKPPEEREFKQGDTIGNILSDMLDMPEYPRYQGAFSNSKMLKLTHKPVDNEKIFVSKMAN